MEEKNSAKSGGWFAAKWVLIIVAITIFAQSSQHGQISSWLSGLFSG